ncbi:hypothetical protein HPB51_021749 [Rhipicephalus microplus]|uniref:Uncharacterized protein n=1 Tax=Rhipicephalus microplus TaxID=6941 RepID=A0A9J6DQJ6_RHIMP|nr:hypothetical protein HPB51_021749 [Rhipicephalus microplus]
MTQPCSPHTLAAPVVLVLGRRRGARVFRGGTRRVGSEAGGCATEKKLAKETNRFWRLWSSGRATHARRLKPGARHLSDDRAIVSAGGTTYVRALLPLCPSFQRVRARAASWAHAQCPRAAFIASLDRRRRRDSGGADSGEKEVGESRWRRRVSAPAFARTSPAAAAAADVCCFRQQQEPRRAVGRSCCPPANHRKPSFFFSLSLRWRLSPAASLSVAALVLSFGGRGRRATDCLPSRLLLSLRVCEKRGLQLVHPVAGCHRGSSSS